MGPPGVGENERPHRHGAGRHSDAGYGAGWYAPGPGDYVFDPAEAGPEDSVPGAFGMPGLYGAGSQGSGRGGAGDNLRGGAGDNLRGGAGDSWRGPGRADAQHHNPGGYDPSAYGSAFPDQGYGGYGGYAAGAYGGGAAETGYPANPDDSGMFTAGEYQSGAYDTAVFHAAAPDTRTSSPYGGGGYGATGVYGAGVYGPGAYGAGPYGPESAARRLEDRGGAPTEQFTYAAAGADTGTFGAHGVEDYVYDPAEYQTYRPTPSGRAGRTSRWGNGHRGSDHRGRGYAEGRATVGPPRDGGPRRRRSGDTEHGRVPLRQVMPLWQELPLLLVVAFCLAVLIRTFLFQAFHIPSGSMEETLLIGDKVLVNKIVYDIRQPTRGEVVVFRGTDNWASESVPKRRGGFVARLGQTIGDLIGVSEPGEKDFIKRVIGLPGDTVECCDAQGRVMVNGYPLDESYVTDNSPLDVPPVQGECHSRRFGPVTVGPGKIFVMGDHRLVSLDARCQGAVPIDDVIGRAFAVVWPSEDWRGLPVPKTFEKVPRPKVKAAGRLPGPGGVGVAPEPVIGESRHRTVASGPGLSTPGGGILVPDGTFLLSVVWMLSHRRVRGVRPGRDDVGSAS